MDMPKMTENKIPILQFSSEKAQDMPFEIFRIEGRNHYPGYPISFRSDFYVIVVITAGAGNSFIDFQAHPIDRGIVYFITPGQVQQWASTRSLTGYILLFQESFLPMNGADQITPRSFDYFHRTDLAPVLQLGDLEAKMLTLCQDMLTAYHEKDFGRTALLQSYLRVFLIQSQRLFVRQQTTDSTESVGSLVTNYIRLIDQHFLQKQRVNEYATLLGVTPGHLTDTTREKLGLPAGQLIQRRVLLEAKRMLTYGENSVGEIAFSLNFTDPSYFARYFRRETGQSPTAFRTHTREKYLFPRSES